MTERNRTGHRSIEREMPADAVPELLASNHQRFLGFVRAKVGSESIAEDILHGAYVKAVEKTADLESESNAVAWFYRILSNATVDHFRQASRERRAVEAFEKESDVSVSDDRSPKVCGCIKDVLPTIKAEYADAITAVDLGGMRVEQLASATGITSNNASVRLHRARAALRKRVVAVCGVCAELGCVDCSCS